MKRPTIILLAVLLFAACQEENLLPTFEVDKAAITIGAEGGTEYLQVTSPTEWVAISTEPWVSISPANGIGDTKCSIAIDSTLVDGARTATLYFRAVGETPLQVSVNQLGFGKQIVLEDSVMSIASSTNSLAERYFEATVTANIPFGVQVEYVDEPLSEWVLPSKIDFELDRGSRPRTTTVRFDWKINTQFDERVARIHFVPLNAEDELESLAVLTLTQEAAPTITDDRAGDSLALITIIDRLQLLSPWEVTENMQYYDGHPLSTGKELRRFVDYVDHPLLGVCWDTAHGNLNPFAREEGQYKCITDIGDRLWSMHISDNFGDGAHHHTWPFAGIINFDEVMQGLLEVDYNAFFNFEASYSLLHHENIPYHRKPWEKDGKTVTKLLDPSVALKQKATDLLYECGKYILEVYGIYEE